VPFSEGDFLLIEYTVTTKEDGKVVDTTSEEEAKKAGIYSPDEEYGAKLVILGEGTLLKPVEEALKRADVSQEVVVEVPPEQAFGPRDPNKVRVVPLRELLRRNITPRINEVVEIDGQKAIVRAITGGRVLLDFNHPLAGKTLVFRVRIVKKIEDLSEKLKELLHRWATSLKREDIGVKIEGSKVTIELPRTAVNVDNLGAVLRLFIRDVKKYIKDVTEITFIEKVPLAE